MSLKSWNVGMGVVQLALAVYMNYIFMEKGTYDTVFPMQEIELVKKETNGLFSIDYVVVSRGRSRFAEEAVLFFIVTGFFHLFYAFSPKGFYEGMISRGCNYFRWVEYSITATLMIRILAYQCGVNDDATMNLITANTIGIMMQGMVVENTLKKATLSSDDWSTVWVATFAGWIMMMMNFFVIVSTYSKLSGEVKNFGCVRSDGTKVQIPDWVFWLVVTQLCFYASFGLIQLYHISLRMKGPVDYSKLEILYLMDSLASKTTLGLVLAYGISQETQRVGGGGFECT